MKRKQLFFIFSVLIFTALILSGFGINTDGRALAQTTRENALTPAQTAQAIGEVFTTTQTSADGDWATVAANPQRTSWTSEQVSGNLQVAWYRPIEAYISQNTQIIAAHGLLYVSTARGLYALNAGDGSVAWRYDTTMPLGNSPTVDGNVIYVAGYDRKLHALNALNGTPLWEFAGAKAGYDTNPLVVDGKIFIGNRDGTMYAIGADGTPQQGQLIWAYDTGAPILISAAYKDGTIFFAANNNYAYALNTTDGHLVWKSGKMPGAQFQSYWPVVFRDKVIFSVAHGYRNDLAPGTRSVPHPDGNTFASVKQMQLADIFSNGTEGQIIGNEVPSQTWAHGYPVVDAHNITEYLEDNPQSDTYKHKPWRRMYVVLNISNGQEFTFDSDNDGFPEYIPATYWGTTSGNRYPPIVGNDGLLYFSNLYKCCSDAKGRVMGWNIDAPGYLSFLGPVQAFTGAAAAVAEPQAISVGGNLIYRNLCCDRVGDWVSYTTPGQSGQAWSYNLDDIAPNYDPMWFIDPDAISRHRGWYQGNSNSMNAAYHNHGDQNAIIPYQGMLFVHRSNTIVAFSPNGGTQALSMLPIQTGQDSTAPLSTSDISGRLNDEIQKMVTVGHLRPGYYHARTLVKAVENYFENPGDTLYTLSVAYPYLSPDLQSQVKTYLQSEFDTYFDNEMYARMGWNGAPREAMELPPEVADDIASGKYPPSPQSANGFLWSYPQINFYAMWKYAANVPDVNAQTLYALAKPKIQVPVPAPPGMSQTTYFRQQPYELNGWIAGYIGFLNLQDLAGMSGTDASLRTRVSDELSRLETMRIDTFTKESYWQPGAPDYRYYKKNFDIVGNFLYMVPELAAQLRAGKLSAVQAAVDEYDYIAPYWFVARYETSIGERGMSLLYNYSSLFKAKALILQEPQQELSKYLDVPAFQVGDLLYIQNLVTLLDGANYTPTPDFIINETPSFQAVNPGEDATYIIQITPVNGFTSTITIEAAAPPELTLNIAPSRIVPTGPQNSTIILSYNAGGGTQIGLWFNIPVTVSGGGIIKTTNLGILIGGTKVNLPLVLNNY